MDGRFFWHLLCQILEVTSQNLSGSMVPKTLIWKSLAPPRVQLFAWCRAKNKVLTRVELRRRGLLNAVGDEMCPLCEEDGESLDHLFVTCPVSWRLWSCFLNLMGVSWVCPGSRDGVMEHWHLSDLRYRRKLVWNSILVVVL